MEPRYYSRGLRTDTLTEARGFACFSREAPGSPPSVLTIQEEDGARRRIYPQTLGRCTQWRADSSIYESERPHIWEGDRVAYSFSAVTTYNREHIGKSYPVVWYEDSFRLQEGGIPTPLKDKTGATRLHVVGTVYDPETLRGTPVPENTELPPRFFCRGISWENRDWVYGLVCLTEDAGGDLTQTAIQDRNGRVHPIFPETLGMHSGSAAQFSHRGENESREESAHLQIWTEDHILVKLHDRTNRDNIIATGSSSVFWKDACMQVLWGTNPEACRLGSFVDEVTTRTITGCGIDPNYYRGLEVPELRRYGVAMTNTSDPPDAGIWFTEPDGTPKTYASRMEARAHARALNESIASDPCYGSYIRYSERPLEPQFLVGPDEQAPAMTLQ